MTPKEGSFNSQWDHNPQVENTVVLKEDETFHPAGKHLKTQEVNYSKASEAPETGQNH